MNQPLLTTEPTIVTGEPGTLIPHLIAHLIEFWQFSTKCAIKCATKSLRSTRMGQALEDLGAGHWLPTMDSNHDKQIQSLLCYRYTSRQGRAQSTVFAMRVNHSDH